METTGYHPITMAAGPKRWVVILGSPRSGTTYLLDVLRALDGFEGTDNAFPTQLGPIWANTTDPALRSALAFSFERTLAAWLDEAYVSRARALVSLSDRVIGIGEFASRMRFKRTFASVGLYKEPFLALAPELPFGALPGCRVIHIFRDGRDVADSLETIGDNRRY